LQDQFPESVALLRQVVKALPNYDYFELGRALLQQGDVTSAIDSLETAKKLVPDPDAAKETPKSRDGQALIAAR